MRIMAYNIRYANDSDGENSWFKRRAHFTSQIKFYTPDIFGVQKALSEQLDHFKANLSAYNFMGVGRKQWKDEEESTASSLLKNALRYYKKHFLAFGKPRQNQPGLGCKISPNLHIFFLLKDKESDHKFYIFITHFDHSTTAKEEGAKLILKKPPTWPRLPQTFSSNTLGVNEKL